MLWRSSTCLQGGLVLGSRKHSRRCRFVSVESHVGAALLKLEAELDGILDGVCSELSVLKLLGLVDQGICCHQRAWSRASYSALVLGGFRWLSCGEWAGVCWLGFRFAYKGCVGF